MRSVVETSSGLALLRSDTRRSGSRASARRQFGVVLCGDRQDRRFAPAARQWRPRAPMSFGGTPASRHSSALRRRRLLRIQLCALNAMGGISVQTATEAGCASRPRSARPGSRCDRRLSCYTLQASLELDRLSDLPRDAAWRLGLAAVIEETSGRKSYWALAHPPGKPDFHHPDCFAHEFSRP